MELKKLLYSHLCFVISIVLYVSSLNKGLKCFCPLQGCTTSCEYNDNQLTSYHVVRTRLATSRLFTHPADNSFGDERSMQVQHPLFFERSKNHAVVLWRGMCSVSRPEDCLSSLLPGADGLRPPANTGLVCSNM